MPKRPDQGLRACTVRTHDSWVTVGYLFMSTDSHLVLLNDVRQGIDFGPVTSVRSVHIEPEADIVAIPRADVEAVDLLE